MDMLVAIAPAPADIERTISDTEGNVVELRDRANA